MKGRFAPSPTGRMHLGNLWVAILSYLSTRRQKGQFVIRIEDIDRQRSKQEFSELMLDDLEWLGFEWDEGPRVSNNDKQYYQSYRGHYYESQLNEWSSKDIIYPCYCNRSRLQTIMSAPHFGELIPIYDGRCRDAGVKIFNEIAHKKVPSYRLKVKSCLIEYIDFWQGLVSVHIEEGLHDFILKRSDGMYAYHLASVLDDIAMGITEVLRGCDLLEPTVFQIYLYQLLGKKVPVYKHAPLLMDTHGHRLSKRQQSITIQELRQMGYSSHQIIGLLVEKTKLVDSRYVSSSGISLDELLDVSLDQDVLKKSTVIL